jgi:hypothetical protein
LTWAHYGADGGDLLAAAVTNGVTHPTGYPLYTLLLQGWLALGRLFYPGAEPARLGNLFSALCAAFCAGWTVLAAAAFIGDRPWRWWIALVAALLWIASPLLWSQALITEVYALHMLLAVALGWALLARGQARGWLALVAALGVANHLTFVLLLPAAAYWVWTQPSMGSSLRRRLALLCGGGALAALLYARIPLVASAQVPAPVNWGYADNLSGLWWLVSGAAYRQYVFGVPSGEILARVAAWASTISTQFTPLGLAAALLGLAHLDRTQPALRNLGLLWLLPVSVYAVAYSTTDSVVYLLPAVWMCTLWIAAGLCVVIEWLEARGTMWSAALLAMVVIGAFVLVVWRAPELSLRGEGTARQFLAEATAVLEPGSIVVSSADAETFALWYGAWASGTLLRQAPGAVLVNYALYQFSWYHRLLGKAYPDVPGIAESFEALIAANRASRPIYLTEPLPYFAAAELQPAGPLWKVVGSQP